jgi:hypothetical protein
MNKSIIVIKHSDKHQFTGYDEYYAPYWGDVENAHDYGTVTAAQAYIKNKKLNAVVKRLTYILEDV